MSGQIHASDGTVPKNEVTKVISQVVMDYAGATPTLTCFPTSGLAVKLIVLSRLRTNRITSIYTLTVTKSEVWIRSDEAGESWTVVDVDAFADYMEMFWEARSMQVRTISLQTNLPSGSKTMKWSKELHPGSISTDLGIILKLKKTLDEQVRILSKLAGNIRVVKRKRSAL